MAYLHVPTPAQEISYYFTELGILCTQLGDTQLSPRARSRLFLAIKEASIAYDFLERRDIGAARAYLKSFGTDILYLLRYLKGILSDKRISELSGTFVFMPGVTRRLQPASIDAANIETRGLETAIQYAARSGYKLR